MARRIKGKIESQKPIKPEKISIDNKIEVSSDKTIKKSSNIFTKKFQIKHTKT